MIVYNKGVNPQGIRPELLLAIICANAYPVDVGVSCIINGEHMLGSLHLSGNAIDFDVLGNGGMDLGGEPNDNASLAKWLDAALPSCYDVVNEASHVHVEYQPK